MKITVSVQTLQPPKPGQPDPWPLLVKRFTEHGPGPRDYILLNEYVEPWADDDTPLAERALTDLGMKALIPPKPRGSSCVVLYNPDTVGEPTPDILRGETVHHDRTQETICGWALGWWMLPIGSGRTAKSAPIGVCSFKFCPWSVDGAKIAAAHTATHPFQGGPFAIAGGDGNFLTARQRFEPRPNWRGQSQYNIGARAHLWTARLPFKIANRSVARQFLAKGWRDCGYELARRTRDRGLLVPTHGDGLGRIDWQLCTDPMADSIIGYETVAAPEGGSDHFEPVVTYDLERVDATADLRWT